LGQADIEKYRVGQTAIKPETRERRMALILEMLSKGKKFH